MVAGGSASAFAPKKLKVHLRGRMPANTTVGPTIVGRDAGGKSPGFGEQLILPKQIHRIRWLSSLN
ncbi:hypothetical protein IID10_14825 [candidate division KSB1 bacterium]|nr:hypothetical protein [candidate division KSB1 bacterium]